MATRWRLMRNGYRLEHSGLRGKLPLRGVAPGINDPAITWRGRRTRWAGSLLGLDSVHTAGGKFPVRLGRSRLESRLRSDMVDVVLDESARCPVRLQLYWRAAARWQLDFELLLTSSIELAGVEACTSSGVVRRSASQTGECYVFGGSAGWIDIRDRFQSRPASFSVLRGDDTGAADTRARPVVNPRSVDTVAPIICYRPPRQSWSFLEMSHPNDCIRLTARSDRRSDRWGFVLFGWDIEKGVILRGRVRGAFVPRRGDLKRAEELFHAFVVEPPHLSV